MTKQLNDDTSYEEFLEIAKRQVPSTREPKNGGGTVAEFFQALADIDEKYVPSLPFEIRPNNELE